MGESNMTDFEPIRLNRYAVALAVIWTAVVSASLALGLFQQRGQVLEGARSQGRAMFENDILYRRWATDHGGVYIPVSKETPPNPYLIHVKEPEVVTPAGQRLALITPSFMTRQVHELGAEAIGHQGHITSLNPIRPENTADPWETAVLESFERGATEISSVEMFEGKPYMRIMRPMLTEQGCLKCHSEQGYTVGDVRGGISVAVSMEPLWDIARSSVVSISVGHGLIWLLGLGGIGLGVRPLKRRIRKHYLAEEEVRKSKDFLQTVIDEIPDALLVIDRDYRVTLANRAVREMAGGKDPVTTCLACYQVSHHHDIPREGESDPCPLKEVIATKAPVAVRHTHFDSEDNEVIVEVSAAPILNKAGEVVQIIELCNDITERVRAEERTRMHQEQLVQMDKMASLGILVSGVAHEINNPNQFVMANLSLLSEAWKSADPILESYYRENGDFLLGDLSYLEMRGQIVEMFSEVLRGCQRIKYIVHELRDFARERPADLTEPVGANSVVASAVTLLTNMIGNSTDHFSVEYGSGLPKLKGSFRRLEQVVISLIQNACQALPSRERAINVSTSYDEDKRSIILEIRDEGVGIPEDALSHITDPFFTTRRDSGGTGLGVAIVSSIINEHGGTLSYSSRPGEGTTVTATLPMDALHSRIAEPSASQPVDGPRG